MAFDWFKKRSTTEADEKTRFVAKRPGVVDFTEHLVANIDMLRALYHNTYPGLKLAGGLVFPAIAVPVYFMGLPIALTKQESNQERLKFLQNKFITEEQQIHRQCHTYGTQWIWPKIDPISKMPVWEFIGDDTVTDIQKDLFTGRVLKIFTDEQINITTGYNDIQTVRRIREFTETRIKIRFEGYQVKGLENREFRNPLGIMPIAFANNTDGGDVRGHSDLERMISDLKIYHDTELAQHTTIAKFRPKLVQYISKNVSTWLANNGFSPDGSDVDASLIDFIINMFDQEKSEFILPQGIAETYVTAKKQIFHKLVQESGVPEICWGLKTEGNNATTEESMGTLSKFVIDKQVQKQESYDRLWNATFRLDSTTNMNSERSDIEIDWNEMETVNEKTKAEIFKMYSEGIEKIANTATGTKEQLWKLWRQQYPQITDEDFEKYVIGINNMAEHKQFVSADWDTVQSAAGFENTDGDGAAF